MIRNSTSKGNRLPRPQTAGLALTGVVSEGHYRVIVPDAKVSL
jgi:hypothetical protein